MKQALLAASLLPVLVACASTSVSQRASAPSPSGASSGLTGVLVPASSEAVSIWPEAYSGELLVLEARPHGSSVAEGDVLAELDVRRIDEQLADAALELRSAGVRHAGLLERNAIAEEDAASKLARTEAALDRARRALRGYETREREFTRRADELAERREAAWEADQLDELEQLEAMYDADELVDATEEIVLKRQRRDVAMTKANNALSRDRRSYRIEVSDELAAEAKREEVARKEEELAQLRRTQAVEAAARADAEQRSAAELEKKERELERLRRDRDRMTLRAPRAGVLLHGSLDALRAGGAIQEVERGTKLSPRQDVFLVADPERLAVALRVPESRRGELADGVDVTVRPLGGEASLTGRLSVASHPVGAQGDESTYEATVELDGLVPEGLVPGAHARVELDGTGR